MTHDLMVCNAKTKLIIIQVIYVTLYVSRWGVIAKNTLYGSKSSTFSNAKNYLCSMKIFCIFPTVNIKTKFLISNMH